MTIHRFHTVCISFCRGSGAPIFPFVRIHILRNKYSQNHLYILYIPELEKRRCKCVGKTTKKSILYGASSKIKDIPLGQGGIGDCDGLVVRGEVSLQHDSSHKLTQEQAPEEERHMAVPQHSESLIQRPHSPKQLLG